MNLNKIKTVAFDADDTLWVNQDYFDEAEAKFCDLLKDFIPYENISKELLKVEVENMTIYGYGVKAFTLSMIEAALRISNNKISQEALGKIINLGKEILLKPVELLDGVEEILYELKGSYNLIMATKGDLLDQERKLEASNLSHHFHHVEIMSNKRKEDYQLLLKNIDCKPENFLMIGNSLKSDILPVVEIGGYAIYVPRDNTWAHEKISEEINHPHIIKAKTIRDILPYFE